METADMDVGYESTDAEDEPTEEHNINNEDDNAQLGPRVRKPP
ncbi:hypothetical protein A2U01_0064784, partial [Trifolium medium]|nr:hypothetical protein [Trifolium medium]